MSDTELIPLPDFQSLSLAGAVIEALRDVGYETPSPIQAETIPHVLAGRDVLAQAQTGTGKTAAFALPLLSRIHLNVSEPQVLVLAPTRELAIQVAEAFQRYAARMQGFHVLPIYGGQDYGVQMKQLKRGAHVIVGTPGRVMDHMRRGTLKLDFLRCLVLDEADEMLRMGFIDDVEWILEQSPHGRQIALFSATLPEPIRRIAKKHLQSPAEITIKVKTTTAESIRQRYWLVSGLHKLDALTRILEAEDFDGIIIFVRTKTMTTDLTEKLTARGYSVAALSGDVAQKQRERTIERLKSGDLDIVVATDVAARGLDVDRVSHVINYDIPYDTEAYVHRIGRTGRFGRKGEAILFVAPREKHMLGIIERATRQKIELMELPSPEMLNNKRIEQFLQRISDTLATEQLDLYHKLIEKYQHEHNVPALEIAAALARLAQGDTPLLLKVPEQSRGKEAVAERKPSFEKRDRPRDAGRDKHEQRRQPPSSSSGQTDRKSFGKERQRKFDRSAGMEHGNRPDKRKDRDHPAPPAADHHEAAAPGATRPKPGMERFRLAIGRQHGVKPRDIVGVITEEAGLTSRHIDQIAIHDGYSTVDLPKGMPREIYRGLKGAAIDGHRLNISRLDETTRRPGPRPDRKQAHHGKPPRKKPHKR